MRRLNRRLSLNQSVILRAMAQDADGGAAYVRSLATWQMISVGELRNEGLVRREGDSYLITEAGRKRAATETTLQGRSTR